MDIERKKEVYVWARIVAAVAFVGAINFSLGVAVVLVSGGIALSVKLSDDLPPFTALFVKVTVILTTGLILHQIPVMWSLDLLTDMGWVWTATTWAYYSTMLVSVGLCAMWSIGGTSYYTDTPLLDSITRVGTDRTPVVDRQRPATRRAVALNMEAKSVWES